MKPISLRLHALQSFPCALLQIFKLVLPITVLLLFSLPQAKAQNNNLSNYQMKFQFRDENGVVRDTILSRINYKLWIESADYPSYVKWARAPFAVALSSISGVGLFTDSSSHFATGQAIGYAFYKISSTGSFDADYMESHIGSFINDSDNPNVDVILTSNGLLIKAKTNISPNTELTASYENIINMFPNDRSIRRAIQYW